MAMNNIRVVKVLKSIFQRRYYLYSPMSTSQSTVNQDHLFDLVKQGFTDGENYDRNRPSYVPGTVDKVIKLLLENHPKPSEDGVCDFLELGAGTGKFTSRLCEQLPEDRKFISSEPMSDFIATLRKRCPFVDARQFSGESIPLPDNSVQGIVAAQCFHWFANKTALDEITRVLKPQGNLVLIWNVKDMKVPWIHAVITRIQQHYSPGEPQYILGEWKTFLDNYEGLKFKSRNEVDYPTSGKSKDEILQHFTTISIVSRLDDEEKKKTLKDIRAILDSDLDTKDKELVPLTMFTDIVHYVKPGTNVG